MHRELDEFMLDAPSFSPQNYSARERCTATLNGKSWFSILRKMDARVCRESAVIYIYVFFILFDVYHEENSENS